MNEWHVSEQLIADFARSPGAIDEVTAASIEQHLTVCGRCQSGLAAAAPEAPIDAIWAEVEDRIDRAGGGVTERLLQRLAVDSAPARLIAATPALRVGTLLAVGVIIAAVVWASRAAQVGGAYLALAPVVPTLLVALSFAPGTDPAGECGLATPAFGFGLLMRRALAIELVTLMVLGVGSLLVPISGLDALGWLLPALALSMGTLAGATRWPAPEVAGILIAAWMGALTVVNIVEPGRQVADSAVFAPAGQFVIGLLAAGACVVVARNRPSILQEAGP